MKNRLKKPIFYGSGILLFMALGWGCANDCPPGFLEIKDARGTRTLCVARSEGGTEGGSTGGSGMTTFGEMLGSSGGMSGSGGQAVCGDGVVEGGEECDNESNTDPPWQLVEPAAGACAAGCLAVGWCGDGVKQGVEVCDNGSNTDAPWQVSEPAAGACAAGCVAVGWCGDGVKQEVEGCDNGSNMDAPWQMSEPAVDVCAAGCVAVGWCGDGVLQEEEECDDGNASNLDACTIGCRPPACGDGFVQAGEGCDDGNSEDNDGCGNDCVKSRLVFVTSETFTGDLGGLTGADDKCKAAADNAKLVPGASWRAWLSDNTGSPLTRFDKNFAGRYRLVDGTVVAKGWNDLTDGVLDAVISVTEQNAKLVNQYAWSNTAANGTKIGVSCMNWGTSGASSDGRYGLVGSPMFWTDAFLGTSCDAVRRLYCFQHSP